MNKIIPSFVEYLSLNELSSNSTLYHRSMHKFKVGDKITSQKNKDGIHWLENQSMEIALESFRKDNFPALPSRFNCVYLSVIPRSRFTDKGYLYTVRPIGKYFMTDSLLIDKLNDSFSRNQSNSSFGSDLTLKDFKEYPGKAEHFLDFYDAKNYWKGVKSLPKDRVGDIEILADEAVVTEVIEDPSNILREGMDVTVTEDEKIKVFFNIFNSKDKKEVLSLDEISQIIKYLETYVIDTSFKPINYDSNVYESKGFLRKGAKLKITFIRTNNSKNEFDNERKGKYNTIMFDFYIKNKLYKRANNDFTFRLEAPTYLNEKIFDIGQYLKQ